MYLIYTTLQTREEAIKIANKLVTAGLVACANVHEGITSIYKWEGKLEQSQEVAMICKAPGGALEDAIAAIKKQHSYACPCILAIKIEKGNEDFLKWVENCNKVDY